LGIPQVRALIATALAELGFDESQPLAEVVLLKDGHHAGWRFEYDGVRAVWLIEAEQIRFLDPEGKVFRTFKIAESTASRAA
jgi:hypothetical protein